MRRERRKEKKGRRRKKGEKRKEEREGNNVCIYDLKGHYPMQRRIRNRGGERRKKQVQKKIPVSIYDLQGGPRTQLDRHAHFHGLEGNNRFICIVYDLRYLFISFLRRCVFRKLSRKPASDARMPSMFEEYFNYLKNTLIS